MRLGMQASFGSKSSPRRALGAKRSSLSRISVLCGMVLALVVVATLQYKWATQLSAATEVRLGNNLQLLMTRWQRDLYDELSAICVAMQVGPDSGAHDAWNDYLQRYADWTQDRAHNEFTQAPIVSPELVKEIYEWNTSGPGRPELLRLNPVGKTLDQTAVPTELAKLLPRLEEYSS